MPDPEEPMTPIILAAGLLCGVQASSGTPMRVLAH